MKYDLKDKYESMMRSYNELVALATDIGKTVEIGDHTAKDAANLFFAECYHFKDWLKKDARILRPQDVEDCISKGSALALAADLCNSHKHAGLNKCPRSGEHLEKINMAYSLDISSSKELGVIKFVQNPSDGDTITISRSNREGSPIATASVVFTIGGTRYNALSVANNCVKEWKEFLCNHGISFS